MTTFDRIDHFQRGTIRGQETSNVLLFVSRDVEVDFNELVEHKGVVVQSVSHIWTSKIYFWWFGFRLEPNFATA